MAKATTESFYICCSCRFELLIWSPEVPRGIMARSRCCPRLGRCFSRISAEFFEVLVGSFSFVQPFIVAIQSPLLSALREEKKKKHDYNDSLLFQRKTRGLRAEHPPPTATGLLLSSSSCRQRVFSCTVICYFCRLAFGCLNSRIGGSGLILKCSTTYEASY